MLHNTVLLIFPLTRDQHITLMWPRGSNTTSHCRYPVTCLQQWVSSKPLSTSCFEGSHHQGVNQAYSEYKHVLANILRSLFVARTPPAEASSPDCRSNVENAPRRRPVTGGPATPSSRMRRAVLWAPSPAGAGRRRAQTPPSRPFTQCRHIAGWTQACN